MCRGKSLENQCESPEHTFFSIYFNALIYWCPEEDSKGNKNGRFLQENGLGGLKKSPH